MTKIIPIKDLRDTKKIETLVQNANEPIMITKNGYSNMVIMSDRVYETIKDNSLAIDRNTVSCFNDNFVNSLHNPAKHYGFVKVATATFEGSVADVQYNFNQIVNLLNEAEQKDVDVLVFPELCLTGYTCSDLFYQVSLLTKVNDALIALLDVSKKHRSFFVVGAPICKDNRLYNVAVVYHGGEILGVVAKTHLPMYREFYEGRQFSPSPDATEKIFIGEKAYPFGNKLLFVNRYYPDLKIGIEICEDLWVSNPPSTNLALNGATLLLNLSASNEVVGKADYRRLLVSSTSARLNASYVYCSSAYGESTTDLVYGGHSLVASNGHIIGEKAPFDIGLLAIEVDIECLINERRQNTNYQSPIEKCLQIPFDLPLKTPDLRGKIAKNPFVLSNFDEGIVRYREIIKMQSYGLLKRFKTVKAKKLIIGLSGGLDSTLAFLIALETLHLLNLPSTDLLAISLPSFGTSKRTYANSEKLAKKMNVDYREINISKTIESHFKDIDHDLNNHNACYENAQARERTQVLLDIANDENALMVGTGDLSELCLGWCTYNGDHMSNYGVNASLPKTAIREIVRLYAFDHLDVKDVLLDIVNTPISPELLPPKEGEIAQKTEDSVGPYELHDFFIYYFLKEHYSMKKILYLANVAFKDKYDEETIKKWLKVFIKRFFTSQFKRSCAVDGVKISEISLSPRTDLKMSSDTSFETFLQSIEKNL